MNGSILITGGLGFIGSHIVDALSRMPECEVVVYDNESENGRNKNVTMLRGDIFDQRKLLNVMQDQEVSCIAHMIGLASIPGCRENPETSFRLNVSSVQTVLEAMRQCDVKRLVFPSTAAVYGATNDPKVEETAYPQPNNLYGCHKLAAEMLIRGYAQDYGLKPTILRLFNVYGDLNKEQGVISIFVRKALAGEPIVVKGGKQLRDFIPVGDVAAAVVKSLDNEACFGETINVGSGVGVTIKEIAAMVRSAFPKVEIKYAAPENSEYSIYADVTRMKKLIGCVATDPKKGIPKFIEECRKRYRGTAS